MTSLPSLRAQIRQARDEKIKAAFDESKEPYGATRLQVELASSGTSAALKTITNSMRRQKLVPKAARKFRITTDSNHKLPVAPNLLGRDFTASAPNQKYVSDITYLMTSEGWLYLAVIIDLYSRSVVGWSMSERMTASLVCDVLSMALFRRGFPRGVLLHSDSNNELARFHHTLTRKVGSCLKDGTSNILSFLTLVAIDVMCPSTELANKHELRLSMSRKGNCWDNAYAESFFHSLKVEVILLFKNKIEFL